ncbi:MAG: HPF/RaiA family ribosome-associated protein [Nitrospirota bacterium]
MSPRLQITARDMELSDWIRDEITRKADKLDEFYDRIIWCRVVVEAPHRHRREGAPYNVRIFILVPGSEINVEREPNQDFQAAIRDAFDAAYRQLEDFSQRRRGEVKQHEEPPHARVSAVFPEKGYGLLMTPDGTEVYFHEHSLLNHDLKHLEIGTEVRFAEERGEKGPQASSVTVLKEKRIIHKLEE